MRSGVAGPGPHSNLVVSRQSSVLVVSRWSLAARHLFSEFNVLLPNASVLDIRYLFAYNLVHRKEKFSFSNFFYFDGDFQSVCVAFTAGMKVCSFYVSENPVERDQWPLPITALAPFRRM